MSALPSNHFSADEIAIALDEALHECDREPRTSLWRSFWDRLTQGQEIPDRPEGE